VVGGCACHPLTRFVQALIVAAMVINLLGAITFDHGWT
jgi:hypothetical protein